MGIDDQRKAIRDAAAQHQSAMAQKQIVFDGIMDRVATHLRQSIASSSGAHTYSLKRHERPAGEEAGAGVSINRRGKKFPLWAYWITSRNPTSDTVKLGSTQEHPFGSMIEDNPDRYVEKGVGSAETSLARDLETHGAGGCAASVVFLVGFVAALTHFV